MLKESGGRLLDFASGRVLTMDRRYGWSRREALEATQAPFTSSSRPAFFTL